ncbi:hypothetical protein [Oceanimonas baumannii]|uniref:Uncharacterized protein n=1 Tax=Oceanimonas baumannii TaxID=129578 RepID=A0A235CJN1_9GAMM|nr:hypothetical protein [Oceanimonas baumannii]OYD24247.1 hypothetical protein B6S09_09240 [Oceanimonas baumannii]TDW58976.1 hypothetical protein LY04_01797 [Oceanimonas baumannii]
MKKHWLWAGLLLPSLLLADDAEIRSAIEEGTRAYEAGEWSQAASQFDYAATLVRQLQAGQLGELFPEPLAGWQADDAETQAAGAALFGGGIHASRHYYKDDAELEMTITKNSPLLQTMAMMFTNPSMAAMSGYKVKRINGQTAMVQAEGDSKELMMLVANTTLIQLSGEGGDMTTADLEAYAGALDIKALSAL